MKRTITAALAAVAFVSAVPAYAADFILLEKFSTPGSVTGANPFYENFHIQSATAGTTTASINTIPTTASFTDNYYFALFQISSGSGNAQSDTTSNINFSVPGFTITGYTMTEDVFNALTAAFNSTDYVTPGYLSTVVGAATPANQQYFKAADVVGETRALNGVTLLPTLFYKLTLDGTSPAPGSSLYTAQLTATTVPEPATWAMMLAGFGAVGFAMRRQRKSHPKVRFAF